MTTPLRVERRAGARADEAVRRFWLGEREVRVDRILDRWLGEDHRYFKVASPEGDVYVLRQDVGRDLWELIQYRRRAPDEVD